MAKRSTREPEKFCGNMCVTALLTDFLQIAGVMFGYKCEPYALVVYIVLGYLTLTNEQHLDPSTAMMVLGQQWTSVGWGSEVPPGTSIGLQLFHGFHAWAGVL